MVNRYRRNAPTHRQPLGHGAAHQQRADQSGARRVGNTVQLLRTQASAFQRGLHQRQQFANVIARGQFRHHATVAGMQFDLTVQLVRQQTLHCVINGHTRFITTGFDAQNLQKSALFALHSAVCKGILRALPAVEPVFFAPSPEKEHKLCQA